VGFIVLIRSLPLGKWPPWVFVVRAPVSPETGLPWGAFQAKLGVHLTVSLKAASWAKAPLVA